MEINSTTDLRKVRTGMKRLLKLADYLKTVPKERFDMSRVVGDSWGGKQDLSCGTSACAMGWAATMPTFRRLGLRLGGGFDVFIKGFDSWDMAAEELFNIDDNDVEALFGPQSPAQTPTAKAVQIRKFVKGVLDEVGLEVKRRKQVRDGKRCGKSKHHQNVSRADSSIYLNR